MAQPHFPANREIEMVLVALQVLQVLFLWLHDWIPLGRLNDVAAVRSQDTRAPSCHCYAHSKRTVDYRAKL
jgi:hypothetical protein